MARNSNGDYVAPPLVFVTETVTPADAVNLAITDLGAALTNSVARDGSGAALADLPMGGFRHTGVGLASARDQYATVGQTQDQAFTWCGQATGTVDALILSPSPAIPAYALGHVFTFTGCATNTGPVTLSVSGLAPLPLQYRGAALPSGFLQNCGLYRALYDGTRFQLEVISTRPAGTVDAVDLADGAVTSPALADGSVTTPKLADMAVTAVKLADGVVTEPKLADGAVTTAKLADAAATTAKLADLSVTTAKLTDGVVTEPKLADGAITTVKLADAATTTEKLADGSVTTSKIAPATVTPSQVTFGTFGPVREKGVDTQLTANDMGILWNEVGGITLKLPDPSVVTDKVVGIRSKGGAGFLTLKAEIGFIDIAGLADPTTKTLTLRSAGDVIWVTSLGTHWLVIQEHRPVVVNATSHPGSIQIITNSTQTLLETPRITINQGQGFNATTSEFTAPYTGTYQCTGCGTFDDVVVPGQCYLGLQINESTAFVGTSTQFSAVTGAPIVGVPMPPFTIQLQAGNRIRYVLFQNSGVDQKTRFTSFANWISITRIGQGA